MEINFCEKVFPSLPPSKCVHLIDFEISGCSMWFILYFFFRTQLKIYLHFILNLYFIYWLFAKEYLNTEMCYLQLIYCMQYGECCDNNLLYVQRCIIFRLINFIGNEMTVFLCNFICLSCDMNIFRTLLLLHCTGYGVEKIRGAWGFFLKCQTLFFAF